MMMMTTIEDRLKMEWTLEVFNDDGGKEQTIEFFFYLQKMIVMTRAYISTN